MPSLIECPKCENAEYYQSRMKSAFEKARRAILKKRPYRCHSCNYRGWVKIRPIKQDNNGRNLGFYSVIIIIAIIVGVIIGNMLN